MDTMESLEYNGFETSDCNSHDDHGWNDFLEYDDFEISDVDNNEYHEWKEVMNRKSNRKQIPVDQVANSSVSGKIFPNENIHNGNNAFRLLDEEAKMVSTYVEEPNGAGAERNEKVKAEETKKPKKKKKKNKKKKKMEVTLPEAMAKIDPSHFADLLAKQALEPSTTLPVCQLVGFVEYFEVALSEVSSVEFPWLEMFKNNCPLSKMIDVPSCHISEPVYKASANWIDQLPDMTVSDFICWASKNIRINLAEEHEVIIDSDQVAIYVALAMVLCKRPHSLIVLLPAMWTEISVKYRKHDEVPFTVWMMAQASQGDLSVGLYSWAHNLLPLVGDKKKCNPQSREYILQLVENILSNPKARTILLSGTLSDGKRLIPPPAFEDLLRLTFPTSSARVEATERFEAIYPLLKEVALAGEPGSDAMKQVTQQIFTVSLRLAGEGNPVLAKEATAITIWSMAENIDCCKFWDNLYEENLEDSVALLKRLSDEWKDLSLKLSSSSSDTLKRTVKSFRLKNEKAITEGGANASLYIDADKSCKVIARRLSRGSGCLIGTAITAVLLSAAGAAAAIMKVSFI